MATKTKESVRLQKLYNTHRKLILDGDKASNHDCRGEYYQAAHKAFLAYEKAGGKRLSS